MKTTQSTAPPQSSELTLTRINPLITREIPFGQDVCDLVFGVDVTDFDFWGSILIVSNNQSRATLWVRVTCLIVGLLLLIIILITRPIALRDIQHGTSTEMHCVG